MAVGDIIQALGTAANIGVTFQPAAGVEIMVTWVSAISIGTFGLTDGTNTSLNYSQYNTTNGFMGNNVKLGITNTLYLQVNANSTFGSFSGIQIK
jgi:hypothetical protein